MKYKKEKKKKVTKEKEKRTKAKTFKNKRREKKKITKRKDKSWIRRLVERECVQKEESEGEKGGKYKKKNKK